MTFDRSRPDDSILLLICILGRFDNEIVRDVLKDLANQFWPGDAVGDGTVGVDASVVGNVPVGEACEAVVLHNTDPRVRAPELLDHAHRDFHGVADDIVLADRVHASRWADKYIRRGTPREPWTPRADRPARQAGHDSSRPRSYRDVRSAGRRCTPPWMRTLVGRRCCFWAWRVLSWAARSRAALCVRVACYQGEGVRRGPRAGMVRAWRLLGL